MVAETSLNASDLIFPLFLKQGNGIREEIDSMPGIFRYSLDTLTTEVGDCLELGIKAFALFPCIEDDLKDQVASEAMNSDGLYPTSIRHLKQKFPESVIMTDVAMDPYSSDGRH